MAAVSRTTRILQRIQRGDRTAEGELFSAVYAELHELAQALFRRQSPNQTLQPTALVHEAWLKLVGHASSGWEDRAHFFRVSARAMRQILVDHARGRAADKRGGGWERVTISTPTAETGPDPIDVLSLHECIEELEALDERQARIIELRFFGSLTIDETSEVLGVSPRTVDLDWKMARAWLSKRLSEHDE